MKMRYEIKVFGVRTIRTAAVYVAKGRSWDNCVCSSDVGIN